MEAAVSAVSQTDLYQAYYKSYTIDVGPIYNVKYNNESKSYESNDILSCSAITTITVQADAIDESDSIRTKLQKLQQRSQVKEYTRVCYGNILGDSEARSWYDKDVYNQPWASAFSLDATAEIIADLSAAIRDLNATIKLINSEIDCLGSEFCSCIVEFDGDENGVLEKSELVYQELIDLLTKLDDYIKAGSDPDGWRALTSDGNLSTYCDRFNRILDINLSFSKECNIRYIETKFSAIQLSIQNVLANDSEYFEDFVNNESDRLDKQISAIEAYRKTHDSQMSALALSQVTQISSDYVNALNDFTTYFMTVSRKIVDSINDDYSYNLSTSAWA